jgi:hypothetical protein
MDAVGQKTMSRTKRSTRRGKTIRETDHKGRCNCLWCEGKRAYKSAKGLDAADRELSEFLAGANQNKRINVGGGPLDMDDVYGT